MTTIIYANGRMGADSRAYSGNRMPIGVKRKIHRLEDGTLIGASSSVPGTCEAFIEWVASKGKHDFLNSAPDFQALVVRPNGDVFYHNDSRAAAGPLKAEHFAIGSGAEYALGALEMGASLEEALQVAARLDPWTEAPFMYLALGEETDDVEKEEAPSPPLPDPECVKVDLINGLVLCDDGAIYPITNFIGFGGQATSDPLRAVSIVVKLGPDRWLSVNLSERFFSRDAIHGVLLRRNVPSN